MSLVLDWRSVFLENGEWGLIGMPAEVISAYYACCVHPYESVVFTIQVQPLSLYFASLIYFRCVISKLFVGVSASIDSGGEPFTQSHKS